MTCPACLSPSPDHGLTACPSPRAPAMLRAAGRMDAAARLERKQALTAMATGPRGAA